MASTAPPATWKGFATVEEYESFMQEPTRVMRLEWRKARRQQHKGLTSHSWLEAHLQDGRRLRLEFYADTGLTESLIIAGRGDRDGALYEDRSAGPHDFTRPLTAERLRRVAAASAATRPYSLTDWNCHHFVLDVWNAVVINMLRRSHYPDRVKTGFLWGATESFGRLWLGSLPWASSQAAAGPGPPEAPRPDAGPLGRLLLGSFSSTAGVDCRGLAPEKLGHLRQSEPLMVPGGDTQAIEGESHGHVRVSAWQEEAGRVSGELATPGGCEAASLDRFAQALGEGAILLLEPGKELVATDLPPELPTNFEAWAQTWLPGMGETALRLAEQLGSADVVDLVVRLAAPGGEGAAAAAPGRPSGLRFASLRSESLASGQPGAVADACFVVLRGAEVRLAIYAVLGPPVQQGGPQRRLRLLSGDAHAGEEGSFAYALQDLPPGPLPASAEGCAREELSSLQIALVTGDWGFVTLL